MATVVKFSGLDRQWLLSALDCQKKVLVRKRLTELPGSGIYKLRCDEIAQVEAVVEKVTAMPVEGGV